jgi:CheY-like chemotaxis protein
VTHTRTVLLIDADAVTRDAAAAVLSNPDLRVLVASAPKEAQSIAAAQAPDVIIIDAGLPDAGAFALGRHLRGADATARIPLVFICDPPGERAAFQSGASALLSKPVDPVRVRRTVDALCAESDVRRSMERALEHLRAGEVEWALEAFQGVAEADAGGLLGLWAQYHAGRILHEQGHVQQALEELDSVLADEPGFWRAHVHVASIYEEQGIVGEAVEHLKRALAKNPHQAAVRRRLEALAGPSAVPEAAVRASGPAAPSGSHAAGGTPPAPQGMAPAAPPSVPRATLRGEEDPSTERLTLADLQAKLAKAQAEAAAAPPVARTAIVADDSEMTVEMIREVLEGAGWRVRAATTGKAALQLAKAERPDLMVLDGLMPGLTGFEVCKEVKETLYPESPPGVLILSAIYTKQRQKTEAYELFGVDEVLAKPCDDAALLEAARRHAAPARTGGGGRAVPPPASRQERADA